MLGFSIQVSRLYYSGQVIFGLFVNVDLYLVFRTPHAYCSLQLLIVTPWFRIGTRRHAQTSCSRILGGTRRNFSSIPFAVLYFLIGTHTCPHQLTIKQYCFSGLILSGMLLLQVTRSEAMDMDGVPLAAAFANSFVPQLFQVSFQR